MVNVKNNFPSTQLIAVSLFAVAMGLLESAVVVYLRELYFPNGFGFPIPVMEPKLALTELARECATLIMLLTLGYLVGRNFISRFAWFLYAFAIWDIFYYVFLKVILHWPASFFTDDVLFLIPVIWIGPVIAPVFLALLMCVLAFIILSFDSRNVQTRISKPEWVLFIIGSIISITAFTWDYSSYILENHSFSKIWVWPTRHIPLDITENYIPGRFNWPLFGVGLLLIVAGIFSFWKRNRKRI